MTVLIIFFIVFVIILGLFGYHACIDTNINELRMDYLGIKFRIKKCCTCNNSCTTNTYILQVKKWWTLFYHDCYWKLDEPDGVEYYMVRFSSIEEVNKRGILRHIGNYAKEMSFTFLGFPVKVIAKYDGEYE